MHLFSRVADIPVIISNKVVPSNIEAPPQAPLVQCINLLHIIFVECRPGCDTLISDIVSCLQDSCQQTVSDKTTEVERAKSKMSLILVN